MINLKRHYLNTKQINKLDHVNVITDQLDTLIDWYENVLGMKSGKRPNFSFPRAWLYAGDQAVVHFDGIENEKAVGS